ncbi:MAG: putative rane protein [Clostridia bacterium]|nr:putative rane protein [Clostridia bacterium]
MKDYKSIDLATSNRIKDMVMTSLLIALVFVATSFIKIRLPISLNGGLIHMGNSMLFTAAIVFGPRKGAFAGAFGMALFDFLSEWAAWTPFTFVVRGVMGYIIGKVAYLNNKKGVNWAYNLMGIFLGSIWMLIGYYFTEVILYGNWIQPFTSIPGNVIQILIGIVVALPLSAALKRAKLS